MAVSLNQWMQSEQMFSDRATTLEVLSVLAEKQLAFINREVAGDLLACGVAHYSSQTAGIEQVCRLLLGVIPASDELVSICGQIREKLISGTDPDSERFWQNPVNYDQRVVEMVAIAMALVDAGTQFWEPLDEKQRCNLLNWLACVQDLKIPPNNWRWFRVLILTVLHRLGADVNIKVVEQDLDFIEDLYAHNGWYQDGPSGVVDYYNPFAFQLYALVYCRWHGYTGERCERLLERVCQFAGTYQVWFGNDGRQLCYGRSLNYRFASVAFWAELARVEHPDVDIGQAVAIWKNCMRWWAEQPIWEESGQLLSGYAYPNLLASEFYTSPVSPLLAFKAFNALALAQEHPFWKGEEKSLAKKCSPKWIGDSHLVWRHSGSYLITNGPASSELRNCEDKYSKFAYSSNHGLCVESTRWIDQGWAGDNIVAFQHPETRQWFGRKKNLSAYRDGNSLVSVWQPFAGCTVTVKQTHCPDKEVRCLEISAQSELNMLLTGYAVDKWSPWFSHLEEKEARLESERLFSELKLIQGVGLRCIYPSAPNTNLLYPHASVPAIAATISSGISIIEVHVLAGCK